jgi:hypothetical protein
LSHNGALQIGVTSIIRILALVLLVLSSQTDNGEESEEEPKKGKTEYALAESHKSTDGGNNLFRLLIDQTTVLASDKRPLGLHQTVEAVPDGRNVLEPLEQLLRHLALDGDQVDHVATEQTQRQVHNGGKRDSCCL